jgi:O-antigen ligase
VLTTVFGLALLGLNFTGGRAFQDDGRIDAWSEGLQFLKGSPLMGIGYRQFTDNNPLTAHNSFVLCFAELGLIGYFFWLALLVITLLELNSLAQYSGEEGGGEGLRKCARAIFLALCVFLAAALFLSRTYTVILYLLVGLGTALADIARKEGVPVFELSPMRLVTRVGILEVASIALVYVAVQLN